MWRLFLLMWPGSAAAESLIATRVIQADAVVTLQDVTVVDAAIPGALVRPEAAIGLQALRAIYPGRPIRAEDLGVPIVVGRNEMVLLRFRSGAMEIVVEGRALAEGRTGDAIRVMNLTSKAVLTGQVALDGTIVIGGARCAGC